MVEKKKKGLVDLLKEEIPNSLENLSEPLVLDVDIPVISWIIPKIPLARITTVYGPESSGKTTFCLHMASVVQKKGGTVFWVDAENSFSPEYAKSIGLDLNSSRLILLKGDITLERVFSYMEKILEGYSEDKSELGLIVWDSIAATSSEEEQKASFQDKLVAINARIMSLGLRKVSPYLSREPQVGIIVVTQVRSSMNASWGAIDYEMYGGRALKHYQSLAVEFRKKRTLAKEHGVQTDIIVQKSKLSNIVFQSRVPVIIRHGVGIDIERTLFEVAKDLGIIDVSGGYYRFSGDVPEELRTVGEKRNFRVDEITEILKTEPYLGIIKESLSRLKK